jgi:hypothetical protein
VSQAAAEHTATTPPARLRRLVERLAELPDGGGDIGMWLAGALADAGPSPDGKVLATALGLIPRPGQKRWQTVAAKARRDELIREFADRYLTGCSPREQARRIAERLGRYQANAWPRHRRYDAPPAEICGTERELLFRILQYGEACSLGTIRRALAHQLPHFTEPTTASYSSHENTNPDPIDRL